jgi:hypothetical protein
VAIQKLEFYEGAAIHRLIRASDGLSIRYDSPFFVVNEEMKVLLKYSTAVRSPWAFTFTPEEQAELHKWGRSGPLIVGMVCGGDAIAAITYGSYARIAQSRSTSLRIACTRLHGEHFKVKGPDGITDQKVAPADWTQWVTQFRRKAA